MACWSRLCWFRQGKIWRITNRKWAEDTQLRSGRYLTCTRANAICAWGYRRLPNGHGHSMALHAIDDSVMQSCKILRDDTARYSGNQGTTPGQAMTGWDNAQTDLKGLGLGSQLFYGNTLHLKPRWHDRIGRQSVAHTSHITKIRSVERY